MLTVLFGGPSAEERAGNSAWRAVERLESLSIVKEISKAKRDRVYCAKAILNILEEPARLSGPEIN